MEKPMTKGARLAAAIGCAIALCLALAACGGGGGADKAADNKKAFVGTWELAEMSGVGAEDMDTLKALGMNVEAAFSDDGTFVMSVLGEYEEGTWEAASSTEVSITANGESMTGTLADGLLKFEADGESMSLKKLSDEVKDLKSAADAASSAAGSGGAAGDLTADQDVRLIDKVLVDDDLATIIAVDKKQDFMGDCGYTLKITNNSPDATIFVTAEHGTWSVNGMMSDPIGGETVKPGAWVETFVWFSEGSIASLDDLTAVEGTIAVWDDATYETLASYPVELD